MTTAHRIAHYLSAPAWRSAWDIARALGLSYSTVRRQLRALGREERLLITYFYPSLHYRLQGHIDAEMVLCAARRA